MDASSVLSDDLSDYDVISDPGRRSLDSSIADLMIGPTSEIHEPPPSQEAYEKFLTARLSAYDIQSMARDSLGLAAIPATRRMSHGAEHRTRHVYVDGFFDMFNVGHALQLRQAKLTFPSVRLTVGVFSDDLCDSYGCPTSVPHIERCEVLRHCRWVDEVLPEAPWQVDEQFLRERHIDYIVVDEGITVDPACDKVRLKGYDLMKKLGKVILTKRTVGLTTVVPQPPPNSATIVPPDLMDPMTPKSPPGPLALESGDPPEPLVEFF